MKINIFFVFILSIGLVFSGCNSSSEPETINTYTYQPSQSEVAQQAEVLVQEALNQTTNILAGYNKINRTLGKISSSRSYNYFGKWHIWKGNIEKSPFDIPDVYQADYTAQIQFLDKQNAPLQYPDNAKGLQWKYNAHAQFGFVDGKAPGDEVWYDIDGNATPLSANPTTLNMSGTYERRWAGIYNNEEANFHHTWDVLFNKVKFFYSGSKNDYWLNGTVIVKVGEYKSKLMFNNSRIATVKVYKNGKVKQSYKKEFPNFYEIYNLPALNNWEMGVDFEFPAPIPL